MKSKLTDWFSPAIKTAALIVVCGAIMRIVLMFNGQTGASFTAAETMKIFALGFVNDLATAIICCAVICINSLLRFDAKYRPWPGSIILAAIVLSTMGLFFFGHTVVEFNKGLWQVLIGFGIYKAVSFALRMFVPGLRRGWATVIFGLTIFITMVVLVLNIAGEYLFWDEFGVRYNFIAVDYLVYTNEVVGNIMESYPMGWLSAATALIAGALSFWVMRTNKSIRPVDLSTNERIKAAAIYLPLLAVAIATLPLTAKLETDQNIYVNELQSNGAYKFYEAFRSNTLDYNKFYRTMPQQQAVEMLNRMYGSLDETNTRQIVDSLPEQHLNIILVTIESMSADFLAHFGNNRSLTPSLDSLYSLGLTFENLYAAGNRTVRGLEALALSIPPSAGESIIKQRNNANMGSVAEILRKKGYTTEFFYGGDSYFDNMETFFQGNGYIVKDRKSMDRNNIDFATVWGVCDEDLFDEVLTNADSCAKVSTPFFSHVMTVSNHRPYTYPEGRIDISPTTKTRDGAVKYTDYAIGRFMRQAAKRDWYDNTIFVFTADHCASSAGSTSIPLDKYRIPAIIIGANIEPERVEKVVSQIDIVPTLFGLMHLSYTSNLYGCDVLKDDYVPRAMTATYQDLGFLCDSVLTVLKPHQVVEQFRVENPSGLDYTQTPMEKCNQTLVDRAVAIYQTAARRTRQ